MKGWTCDLQRRLSLRGKPPCRGMFRKIHNVFRPNHHGHRGHDLWSRSDQDYHSACTVRLVRSTSVLLVGEHTPKCASTLKRSKSTASAESTSHLWPRQEDDRMSLSSQNHLEYLEALMDLRRQYSKSMNDFTQDCGKVTVTSKKKRAPPPPKKDAVRWRRPGRLGG